MEDNEEFEVEKIVAQRENHGCIEYKIRWKNYGSDFDTWEPESNLIGCDQVLKNFKLQNTIEHLTIKEDVEDGEVSESDSSDSVSSDHRRSKKSKKKKSKRRTNSKSHSSVKGESYQGQVSQSVSNDFGIKVEIAMNSQRQREKPSKHIFTPNFSMGASELLFSYSSQTINTFNQMEVSALTCKQEMLQQKGENEAVVVVKEEKSFLDNNRDQIDCGSSEDIDEDSDLDGQLKMVTNDDVVSQDAPLPPNDCQGNEPSVVLIAPVLPVVADHGRSWRDREGVFKIRKSQRKDNDNGTNSHGNDMTTVVTEETSVLLARDKWPSAVAKVKDGQAEAFYGLGVVATLGEARSQVEMRARTIARDGVGVARDEVCRAVEEGNTAIVWAASLTASNGDGDHNVVSDGALLVLAARLGYADIAGIIIRSGADVNYEGEEGNTPLMAAAEFGHESMCQLLIDCGAYINVVNKKQESAITKAVSRGNFDCLVVLLQRGCDVFNLDSDRSPLHLARQRNLHEMEQMITEYSQRLTETLTLQFVALTNSCINVSYILFPLRVVSSYENDAFTFEFVAKIPPVRDDECNLLAIFSGYVQDKQLKYCIDKESNVKIVTINDIEQQSLFPNGDCSITSMAPILDGKNVLSIKCHSRLQCRWARMLIIGFRVKIVEKN